MLALTGNLYITFLLFSKKTTTAETRQHLRALANERESDDESQQNYEEGSLEFYKNLGNTTDISTVNVADLHDWDTEDIANNAGNAKRNYTTTEQEKPGSSGQKTKAKRPKVSINKRWTWSETMVENLIFSIQEYKNSKTFEGVDFESDFVEFYEGVREMVAAMYPPTDFGPVKVALRETDEMTREEMIEYKQIIDRQEKQRKDGYNRIKAKIKELRRGYKSAVDKGTRSGSGRIVKEHFEVLQDIWSGCPAVNSLEGALTSIQDELSNAPIDSEGSEQEEVGEQEEAGGQEEVGEVEVQERPVVVKDNKRTKLQKKLSAHQRDMMLIDISKEELKLKRENIALLRESIEETTNVMKAMTESMTSVGNSVKEGLALIAQSFVQSAQMQPQVQPAYQMPYMMSPPGPSQTPKRPESK